ncbi:hypothetical protein BDU57DRAFT_306038 [Ampelomyces quisqualis]|uniref:Uncharacterized protein n=1 Tax=Ampelomyces quisqualis TaxID=50730 RepID=A0A6A5QHH8_AMPQU|nr:hypothetical protein BDU57DRAFT_306038 [Ampelomyces quisqualis]
MSSLLISPPISASHSTGLLVAFLELSASLDKTRGLAIPESSWHRLEWRQSKSSRKDAFKRSDAIRRSTVASIPRVHRSAELCARQSAFQETSQAFERAHRRSITGQIYDSTKQALPAVATASPATALNSQIGRQRWKNRRRRSNKHGVGGAVSSESRQASSVWSSLGIARGTPVNVQP